jgi:hypothetical protein
MALRHILKYLTPRAMMADSDLALGRVLEAVSKSPRWKETSIFAVEDDAQSGPDHVGGHWTVFMATGPFNRRKTVDSSFYTQANLAGKPLSRVMVCMGLRRWPRIEPCLNSSVGAKITRFRWAVPPPRINLSRQARPDLRPVDPM